MIGFHAQKTAADILAEMVSAARAIENGQITTGHGIWVNIDATSGEPIYRIAMDDDAVRFNDADAVAVIAYNM